MTAQLGDVDPVAQVDFHTARARSLALTRPLAAERVALADATGRVLAETLVAREDLVPFARSAMDGYAVRVADVRTARPARPLTLRIAGSPAYAGAIAGTLPPGVVMRIATGGVLPSGADAVVPFEDVDVLADAIRLHSPVESRAHVFEAGDDARRGDVLARAGDVLTAGRAGLLAAGGYAQVAVRRRPRVAIVSTGDELVDIAAEPRPGQIRNSNAAMLAAVLAHDGADIVSRTHADDRTGALRTALAVAVAAADLVITTGGASVGERDFIKPVLRGLGARFAYESVAVRPAKPTAFALVNETLVAVLPGNPAAAYIGYVALMRGVVHALAGRDDLRPPQVMALLERGRIHRKDARHFLMFGVLRFDGTRFRVRLLDNQCSSLTRGPAEANALIVAAPGSGYVEADEEVPVEVTDWRMVTFASTDRC